MKKCSHCGAEMDDTANFCPSCGARYEEPGQPVPSYFQQQDASSPSQDRNEPHPMKWHNFQMVTMIIGAVFTVLTGFMNMNGSAYLAQGLDPSVIYGAYPALKTCDTAYGVAGIAIGVFQLYTRNRLKGFFRDAPRTLAVFYAFSLFAQIVYICAVSSVLKASVFSSVWTSLAGPILMMCINGVYYRRRRDLFIH